jgi:5'-nucleotidase
MLTRRHILAGSAGLAAAGWVRLSAAQPVRTLSVLHQNDLHSRHDPDARGVGGSARLASLLAREKAAAAAEGRAVITLDAGDQFMGSLYYTHWRGEAEREVMAAIGFDAMALGNHEFDNGPEVLARFARGLGIPVLSANTDVRDEPLLAGLIPPGVLLERGGMRIAMIGLTPPETATISSPGPRVRFADPAPALAAEVARLRAAGASTVIALTHLGLAADRALVAGSRGLDLVVGGHSHTLLANGLSGAAGPTPVVQSDADGRQVPIVQVGAYGRCIGRVDLALDAAGRAAAFRAEAIEAVAETPPDPRLVAVLARLEAPIAALRAQVVGQASGAFPTAGCRRSECALGNAVADSMLHAARRHGAVAAITNAGGLRAPINPGPVTLGDVNAVLPFGNTLTVLTLSGADLRALLEHAVGLGPEGTGSGRFPQVAGLAVRFDPARPPGNRLTHLAMRAPDGGETPVVPDAQYRLATNSFLRAGGDGYVVLRDRATDVYEASQPMDEILAEAFSRAGTIAPRLDGRLIRAE